MYRKNFPKQCIFYQSHVTLYHLMFILSKKIPYSTMQSIRLKSCFTYITDKADSRLARLLLYVFSALESIIIPIPVDPYLAVIVLARKNLWIQIGLYTALASVIGGSIGWYIGGIITHSAFWTDIQNFIGAQHFLSVKQAFEDLGAWLILIGAFTPLPYKVIAISAGLSGYGLIPFILISFVGRATRFLLIAAATAYHRDMRLLMSIVSLLLILIAIGVYVTKHI